MTLDEIIDESHLLERPYVQALLLIVSYPVKAWDPSGRIPRQVRGLSPPDPEPFYFNPLQKFEDAMRESGRVPEAGKYGPD